jgi:Ku protein
MDRFVQAGEMDARYYDTPYFLLPRDAVSQEAYAVIREALARKKMVGLGTVVLATRERPIAVQPAGRGLLGMTLRFNHDVRDVGPYFGQIPDLMMPDELAEELIAAKATKFDPALLEDRYRTALVGILRQKQAQQPRKQPSIAEPSRNNVVDLMKTLRRSIAEEQPQRTGERMNSVRRSLKTKKASTRPSASRSGRKTA